MHSPAPPGVFEEVDELVPLLVGLLELLEELLLEDVDDIVDVVDVGLELFTLLESSVGTQPANRITMQIMAQTARIPFFIDVFLSLNDDTFCINDE